MLCREMRTKDLIQSCKAAELTELKGFLDRVLAPNARLSRISHLFLTAQPRTCHLRQFGCRQRWCSGSPPRHWRLQQLVQIGVRRHQGFKRPRSGPVQRGCSKTACLTAGPVSQLLRFSREVLSHIHTQSCIARTGPLPPRLLHVDSTCVAAQEASRRSGGHQGQLRPRLFQLGRAGTG